MCAYYIHHDSELAGNHYKFGITTKSQDELEQQYQRRIPNGRVIFFYKSSNYRLIEKNVKLVLKNKNLLVKRNKTNRFTEVTTTDFRNLMNISMMVINEIEDKIEGKGEEKTICEHDNKETNSQNSTLAKIKKENTINELAKKYLKSNPSTKQLIDVLVYYYLKTNESNMANILASLLLDKMKYLITFYETKYGNDKCKKHLFEKTITQITKKYGQLQKTKGETNVVVEESEDIDNRDSTFDDYVEDENDYIEYEQTVSRVKTVIGPQTFGDHYLSIGSDPGVVANRMIREFMLGERKKFPGDIIGFGCKKLTVSPYKLIKSSIAEDEFIERLKILIKWGINKFINFYTLAKTKKWVKLFRFLIDQNIPISNYDLTFIISWGDIEIIRLLPKQENLYVPSPTTIKDLALEYIGYFREVLHKIPSLIGKKLIYTLIESNKIEHLEFIINLISRDILYKLLETKMITCAAKIGLLDIIKLLRANGCSWGQGATSAALKYGHVECFDYLIKMKCPLSKSAKMFITLHKDKYFDGN